MLIGAYPAVAHGALCGDPDASPGGRRADPVVAPCRPSVPQHRTPIHSMLLSPRRFPSREGRGPSARHCFRFGDLGFGDLSHVYLQVWRPMLPGRSVRAFALAVYKMQAVNASLSTSTPHHMLRHSRGSSSRTAARSSRFVQRPRRPITRRVLRAVLLVLFAPRLAVLPTRLAPRRTRRRAAGGTSAWLQSALMVSGSASGRGAASADDVAVMMAGATAKPPKKPSRNLRRSISLTGSPFGAERSCPR